MLSKKVKSRIFFLVISLFIFSIAIFIGFKTLQENVVYFLSPTEVYNIKKINYDKKIRIGGLVKEKSIKKSGTSTNFIVTDNKNEIIVTYNGMLPNLFAEGKGVVAEGKFKDRRYFVASKILAKHDENYMPPEVKKALEY
tara:strand:- start:588 stop:1007 length:420 start_codon:yes stop_codon:yes gene_type:complete